MSDHLRLSGQGFEAQREVLVAIKAEWPELTVVPW